jgi:2-dehydro-3-deoxygalactonokinase
MIAIDWGTSALRGALLDRQGAVVQERSAPLGILHVPPGGFEAAFNDLFGDWMRPPGQVALMAGMVGSQQGWQEAPYCPCPASAQDIAATLSWVQPGCIAIVPGLSCRHDGLRQVPDIAQIPDVMRGEETQILGALAITGESEATLVLPGTHSKWASVGGHRIEDFTTYLTGEIYQLLRQHSILARTLVPATDATPPDEEAFDWGVMRALEGRGGLLHTAFSVRTLSLFRQVPPARLPDYLSGLVIGEEVRAQAPDPATPVLVVGASGLTARYERALSLAGIPSRVLDGGVTWKGLWQLARHLDLTS